MLTRCQFCQESFEVCWHGIHIVTQHDAIESLRAAQELRIVGMQQCSFLGCQEIKVRITLPQTDTNTHIKILIREEARASLIRNHQWMAHEKDSEPSSPYALESMVLSARCVWMRWRTSATVPSTRAFCSCLACSNASCSRANRSSRSARCPR